MEINNLKWRHHGNFVWIGAVINALGAIALFATAFWHATAQTPVSLIAFVISILVAFAGTVVLIVGLWGLREIVPAQDGKALMLVIIGFGLPSLINWAGLNPALEFIDTITTLIASIILMVGTYKLKHSMTFPYKGTQGASIIFNAMIVALVGGFLGGMITTIFPQAGIVILLGVIITAMTMQLVGFYQIKTADPDDYLGKYKGKSVSETNSEPADAALQEVSQNNSRGFQ